MPDELDIFNGMNLELTHLVDQDREIKGYINYYRDYIVDEFVEHSVKLPRVTFMIYPTRVPRNIINDNKRFRRLFACVMNIDVFKFTSDDTALVVDVIMDRDKHFRPMREFTFGEILLGYAKRLVQKYGGNIKFWLICMFWNLGLYNNKTNYIDIFQEIAIHRYFSDSGYGIFKNPGIKITSKRMSFSTEFDLFVRNIDKYVVPF